MLADVECGIYTRKNDLRSRIVFTSVITAILSAVGSNLHAPPRLLHNLTILRNYVANTPSGDGPIRAGGGARVAFCRRRRPGWRKFRWSC